MDQYYHLQKKIKSAESELSDRAAPYAHLIDKLKEIPGIDKVLALGVLAEATADMSHFPDERHFAAWAGVAAGNNESAGKKKEPNAEKATPI